MHISEGILPLGWAAFWFAVSAPFVMASLAKLKKESFSDHGIKPLLGMAGAAVFIISCMPVPVPTAGTCSHPAGTAMAAILVGPLYSILAATVALLLQALFLAHGGLTTLGANVFSMGVVGSLAGWGVYTGLRKMNAPMFAAAFMAGVAGDWATYAVTSFSLASALHGPGGFMGLFTTILVAFIPTQLPLGLLEGFMTAGAVVFLYNRRPELAAGFAMPKLQREDADEVRA
jgi:cobalt/nickel transport system permease protein